MMGNGFCLDSAWPYFKFGVKERVALEKSEVVALGQIVYGICLPALQSWYLQGIGPLAPPYPARWKVGLDNGIYLAITAIGVYFKISAETLLYSFLGVIGLFKITLLYKTYKTFLFKIYCFMHLLSYLCALEIIPLMALGVLLMNVTDSLITKF